MDRYSRVVARSQEAVKKKEALKKEKMWDTLVQQIVKGNVIPVLGNEMAKIGDEPSSRFLLREVAVKSFGIEEPVASFTALMNHPLCDSPEIVPDLVYAEIGSEENAPLFQADNGILREFLEIKHFPFVITTATDPIIENTMRTIHGDKLRVLRFANDPERNGDIRNSFDTKTPTLYYMFGKANGKGEGFVLSDTDLLRFARSWLLPTDSGSRSKPANLSNALSNKYLLVLGNSFHDWLFRFFWFAMKDEKLMHRTSIPNGMEALERTDEQLIEFLNFANITSQISNLPDFVAELKERLAEYESENRQPTWFDNPQMNTDVFISYSRADEKVAELLYEKLRQRGLSVWFDRKNLGAGVPFRKEIRNAIRTCRCFVPVFSNHIAEQADEEHVYRLEWEWAIEHKKLISESIAYIVPLTEQSFDMYNQTAGIPEEIQVHNAAFYEQDNPEPGLDEFADALYDLIKQKK